jgi:hypothetical protein
MKVGDLVRFAQGGTFLRQRNMVGFVMRVDPQHYGSSTAYKVSQIERGKCIRSNMVDFIGVTADGIRDRVLVLWSDDTGWEYCESTELEVINESR